MPTRTLYKKELASQNQNERLAQADYTNQEHPKGTVVDKRAEYTALEEQDMPHLMTIFAVLWRVHQLELGEGVSRGFFFLLFAIVRT